MHVRTERQGGRTMYTDPILELQLAKDHIRELAKEHRSVSHWQTPRARTRASGQRLSMRTVLVAVFSLFFG